MSLTRSKLLIISFKIPFPLSNGGAIAQDYFLHETINNYDVTFCTVVSNDFHKTSVTTLEKLYPNLKIEYLNLINAKKRKTNILVRVLQQIYKKFSYLLSKEILIKDKYLSFSINQINEEFILFMTALFEKKSFDIIQLEFFETLSLLPSLPLNVKKIFIHHEIRAKRNEFFNPDNAYSQYLNKVMKLNEISLLNLADLVIVFNREDQKYIEAVQTPVMISPFGIPDNLIIKKRASNLFDKFIFLGNENHYPNKEGLFWFLEKIYLPNLDKIKLPIFITGEWTAAFKKKYSEHKAINFVGFLEDLSSLYDQSIMISPIISGSGLRTKILHAYANSVPVISTKFASEGLFDTESDNNHIFHFENDKDFVKISETILKNQYLLKEVAINGNRYYLKNFDFNNLLHKRFEAYSLE